MVQASFAVIKVLAERERAAIRSKDQCYRLRRMVLAERERAAIRSFLLVSIAVLVVLAERERAAIRSLDAGH